MNAWPITLFDVKIYFVQNLMNKSAFRDIETALPTKISFQNYLYSLAEENVMAKQHF